MANYPPPYPPGVDWKAQRRAMKDQVRFQRQQARMQQRAMRRGSIVGPLLLVVVGVVFLLVEMGRVSWMPLAEWFGRWWPLLFIVAGLIRLAEWGMDQHVQQTRTAQGLPPMGSRRLGGVIWLLILVAILGGLAHAGARAFDWNEDHFGFNRGDLDRALGNPHDSDVSLSHAIAADGVLTIDNPRGDVTVSGTSDDGQLHIAIHKQVFSFKDQDVQAKTRELEPTLSGDSSRLSLSVPRGSGGGHADLSIDLPRGVNVTVTADRGDVKVAAMHAPVTVNANHGSIDLSGLTGPVVAHMHNDDASFSAHSVTGPVTMDGRAGDITVSDIHGNVLLGGAISGETHVERVDGNVRFHTHRTDFQMARLDGKMDLDTGSDLSADQVLGPVVLKTNDRNITLERVQGNVEIVNTNGSVKLISAAPLGSIEVTNKRGSVDVGVPASAGFVVEAATRNGDINNEFSLAKHGKNNSWVLDGTAGQGGPTIRIVTTDGDVTLRKSAVVPLPPVAPAPPKITVEPAAPPAPKTPKIKVPTPPAPPLVP